MDEDHIFDDALFGDADRKFKEGILPHKQPYSAKICENEWFLTCKAPTDLTDKTAYHKYRADYHYLKRNFKKAIVEYNILASVNPSPAVRRDVIDSQCRCFLRLGMLSEAMATANKMVLDAVSDDHLLQAWLLLGQVQHQSEQITDEIATYQRSLFLAPATGSLWLKLADAYSRACSARRLEQDGGEASAAAKQTSVLQARLFCLLNASHLLQVSQSAPSFYQRKADRLVMSIQSELNDLQYDSSTLDRLNTVTVQMPFSVSERCIAEIRRTEDAEGINSIFDAEWMSPYRRILDPG